MKSQLWLAAQVCCWWSKLL